MTTREQLAHELAQAGLKNEAQYVAEIGIPDLAQVQSILADKVNGPVFERILRKLGITVPK